MFVVETQRWGFLTYDSLTELYQGLTDELMGPVLCVHLVESPFYASKVGFNHSVELPVKVLQLHAMQAKAVITTE